MRRNAKTQSATSQTQLTAHFASGRRSGAPRQRKIIWAVAGAVVAIVAAITFFIAALSTFGGGGSGGGSSSGHSQTWQNGYNSGLEQATAPAGPYTDPSQYCGTFAIVAAITFFIAALSTFGGGGSGGGSSSGHSQTWQNGYNSGLEQATVIALIESPQVCSAKFLTCEQGSV